MWMRMFLSVVIATSLAALQNGVQAWIQPTNLPASCSPHLLSKHWKRVGFSKLRESSNDDSPSAQKSLEEKMKAWEASEEEVKAATLGGVVPGSMQDAERSDAFDVGLWVVFPLMVAAGLFFALFPFIMGSIDTSSVGPPPTV